MIDSTQLETQNQALLTHINGWSLARLSYRPSPAAWSAVEVFDHLVKTEEGILAFAKQGLAMPHKIGIRDRLGLLFIQKIFQSDRKVKVPGSAVQVLPDRSPDLETILQRWQSTRNDFAAFQSQLSPQTGSLRALSASRLRLDGYTADLSLLLRPYGPSWFPDLPPQISKPSA